MLAPKTSVLHHPKEDSVQKKTLPYYLKAEMFCPKGHDRTKNHRADGRCGKCHFEWQTRYRNTKKGSAIYKYAKMKYALRKSIKDTKARIAELEREQ